ncbi:RNA-binding protein 8A [Entamoeba marina]
MASKPNHYANRHQKQVYEEIKQRDNFGPARSVEGWVIFLSGLTEEVELNELKDMILEYGKGTKIVMPLNKRTGEPKGYALLEFKNKSEAEICIKELQDKEYKNGLLKLDWAFSINPH